MSTKPKFLRSGLVALLALCLFLGLSVTALAAGTASCGEDAAKTTVEQAVFYCSNAVTVVDVVEEYALGSYSSVISMASGNPEKYRSAAVGVIKDELVSKSDMIAKVGFDPNSDEDMDLLANEVYDVAISFYLDNQNYGKTVARENATKEVVRFVLVEVDGYSNSSAVETAEYYYELNEIANSEGKTAAIEYVMSQQTHNYKNGVCAVCGAEDPNHVHSYGTKVVAPTCTEDGYTVYTCACGHSYSGDEVKATGHTYTSKTVAPTCTVGGYTVYSCACGHSYTGDEVKATGHTYTSKTVTPTCVEGGYTVYTCACGYSYTGDEVKATGHNYAAKTVAPTCTEDGYTVYTCACGDNYTETLKATGHNYKAETVNPTCIRDGYTTYTCTCGHSYTEVGIPATGHNYVNGTCDKCGVKETHTHSYSSKVVAPTCTTNGYTVYTCSCGDKYETAVVEATGHSYTKDQTVAPTCCEAGYTLYICSICGDSYEGDVVAATGHNYTRGMTVAPTCTEAGYTEYSCSCGESYEGDLVEATGHNYTKIQTVAPTCTEAGYSMYTCACGESYEGDVVEATGHNYLGGTCDKCGLTEEHVHSYTSEVVAPTCTANGYTVHTCECGDSYKDNSVVATGHDYINGVCSVCKAEEPGSSTPTKPDEEDDKNESSDSSFSWSDLFGNIFGGDDDDMSFGDTLSAAASKLMDSIRSLIKDWLSWLDYSGF